MKAVMDEGIWRSLTVDEQSAGWRVDYYLSRRFPRYSRTQISAYIRSLHIVSEQRRLKSSSRLLLGEHLRIFVPGLAPTSPPPPPPPIVYEDDVMLVVNKPSGMLVHPAGSEFVWAMVGLVRDLYPDHVIDLVHRLDRETSGAVLMTKDKKTNAFLKQEIKARRVQKVYQAIVLGCPAWDVFDLHAPVGIDPNSELRIRRCVLEGGQAAHTTFRVLKRFKDLTHVECVLHTGRTHQIRVHLEHLEHPILGDKIYGQPDQVFLGYMQTGMNSEIMQKLKFPRQALHASQVVFQHPSGEKIQVRIPLWSDMMSVLEHGFVPDSLLEFPS